jgi:hypothetical protein
MNRYEILWIDDQFEEQEAFLEYAYQNGIDISPYKTSKSGMEELKHKLFKYDGVILDAKVFNESEDEVAKLTGLTNSIYAIKQLADKRITPYFIFTGQPDVIDNATFSELVGEVHVYKKTIDNAKLIADIKSMADQQNVTQIKHKYQKVFEACTDQYIGDYATQDLLDILSNIENDNLNNQFTTIRKIVEDIFRCFDKYELLPSEFITPSVSLQGSSRFLSGQTQKEYTLNPDSILPKVIADSLRSILDVTQPASHRAKIDEHLQTVNNTYLVQGSIYQLLDVIVWVKNHIDSNPVKESWTKQNDTMDDSIVVNAFVEKDLQGNYHCGDIILTYKHISDKGYTIGDEIRIVKFAENTNEKTLHSYKKSALQTEKI